LTIGDTGNYAAAVRDHATVFMLELRIVEFSLDCLVMTDLHSTGLFIYPPALLAGAVG
jgi:hypothetical protein